MTNDACEMASIFVEPSNWLDRLVRKAGDQTYVVECQLENHDSYGFGYKRHQRRYADLLTASRRLDYLLVKYPSIKKAFILDFPLDVEFYRHEALHKLAHCLSCGSYKIDWKDRK